MNLFRDSMLRLLIRITSLCFKTLDPQLEPSSKSPNPFRFKKDTFMRLVVIRFRQLRFLLIWKEILSKSKPIHLWSLRSRTDQTKPATRNSDWEAEIRLEGSKQTSSVSKTICTWVTSTAKSTKSKTYSSSRTSLRPTDPGWDFLMKTEKVSSIP